MVAYEKLKTMRKEPFEPFSSKSGHGRLQEVVDYKRFQIWKLLVFLKTGRWGEVVASISTPPPPPKKKKTR